MGDEATKNNFWQRSTTVETTAIVGAAGLILGISSVHIKAQWPQFGDLPTWVAALAAIAAGVYAARTYETQKRQYDELAKSKESSDRLLAYQEHAAARAFARRVQWNPGIRIDLDATATTGSISAHILNDSEGTIHDPMPLSVV